jgi:hypothetical protein
MNETVKGAAVPANATPLREVLRVAAQESDFARWLSSGARLLAHGRQKLAEAEHDYAVRRARIIADAEKELAQFRQATREKLREFEAGQQAAIRELRREVERLEAMQEVPE